MGRVEIKFALEYTRYLENPTEEDIAKEINDIHHEIKHYRIDPMITVTNEDTGRR